MRPFQKAFYVHELSKEELKELDKLFTKALEEYELKDSDGRP